MQRVLVNAVSRVRLDHFSQFEIAADRAQFHISKPFPRRALFFQVIEKTIGTRHERSVFAVRTQTQVDSIQITLTRDARKRRDHQLDQARVSFVLRERLDRGWDQRVVSEQNVEIGSVVDAATAKTSQTVDRESMSTGERSVTTRT